MNGRVAAVWSDRHFLIEDAAGECHRIELMDDNPPAHGEVLKSITRGLSNPDISKQLGISLNAVKQHIRAVFAKLGAANRTEAVAIAMRKHLLKL